jgi:hypothetical protein
VLAITDHWHVTDHAYEELVLIPSSELSCRAATPSGEAEVLALGVAELPEPREHLLDLETLAAWIAARGGYPVLCHPYWSGLSADEIVAAPSLAALEVWNGSAEAQQGNGLSSVQWDEVLQRGSSLAGVATDDCHAPGLDSGLGWTWVLARERSAEALLDALRAGRFYGSAGPRLLGVESGADDVHVRCSPCRSVRVRSGPWDGCAVNADNAVGDYRGRVLERDGDGLVTAAVLERPELWRWARVEIEDAHGRRAWSNPFSL